MEIDVHKTGGVISPLWFGHNLEHTRRCLWQGLCAQLLRNRKFVVGPVDDGVARHWYRIGPRQCSFTMERTYGRWNEQGEAYTTRFYHRPRRRDASMQRQRIQSLTQGQPCGIGQGGLQLIAGKGYEGFLALLSDRKLTVDVQVIGRKPTAKYFHEQVTLKADAWTEFNFQFAAQRQEKAARLQVTFQCKGVLCVGAASLLPSDHFHGMRRDVIGLLQELPVPILRWPGGNFAGSYLWRDGLLPVHRRAPVGGGGILPYTNGTDEHEIGTDEFMALCAELGSEPWITINMSLEGPEEAAAWVEYCNGPSDSEWGARRAERGHAEPYEVKYWSLGNEMGYGHMGGPNKPERYAEAAAACAKAMKAADPSIVLVASGTWWEEEWYRKVLAQVGDCFDHISYHQYTALMKDFEGETGRKELWRLASAAEDVLHTFEEIRARLDAYAPGEKPIGISFDEWNIWGTWFHGAGVAQGIYTGAMLSMFCREARKVGMTFGAFFEPVNEGAIVVGPDSARLTPMGKVFSMFRPHQGNVLIEVEAPTAETGLDIAASVDETEKELTLTLVNGSAGEDGHIEFALKNVEAVMTVKAVVLTSPDFLPGSDFTEQDLDVRVTGKWAIAVVVPPHSVARMQIKYR